MDVDVRTGGETAKQYAGFWLRIWAQAIDRVVLMLLGAIWYFPLSTVIPWGEFNLSMLMPVAFAFALFNAVIEGLYYSVSHASSWQATVGKHVLGLRVVDSNGGRLSFGRAVGRYCGYFVSGILLCVGFMMVGWTRKKQGLHDMIAGTFVIKA